MKYRETRRFLGILYILVLLFLGILYFQADVLSSPEAISTLQQIEHDGGGTFFPAQGFEMSTETLLLIVAASTACFGLAFLMQRSSA